MQLDKDGSLSTVTSKMPTKKTILIQMQIEVKIAAVKSMPRQTSNSHVSKPQSVKMEFDCKYCGKNHKYELDQHMIKGVTSATSSTSFCLCANKL